VWVRARSKQYQKRSSAWTAWVDVTLDALTTLGAVSTSAVTASSVTLSWTNTDDTQSVFVYLYQGATAPASWTTYQIAELVPGSTTTTIRTGISSGLQYVAAIAYSTPVGPSAFQTATFTATGTGATLTRPAGLAIIPGSVDAALPRGVVVALYPSNSAADIAVYRAPDVSGSPGTFALLDVVTGTDSVYIDSSVTDGATYWYALTHRLGGFTESAQTPSVQASVSGVPVNVVRPPAVAPTITPATTGTSTDVELTIAVTDPQKRVALVEFRTSNAGAPFSAWTADTSVPYSTSVAKGTSLSPSSIQWRVYGFTNEGTYTELRSGESKWPLNVGTNPTINRLTRSGYNASTGRYEVWGRYFYNVGDGTYLEDPILGFLTIFTCINVKNQAGTSAVVTDHTPKEADGWRFSWPSSSTDQWTFELTSYGLAETLIFPGQDSDQQIEPLPTIQGSATFIAPSGQSTSGTEPWVSELIEVVWDAPGAETSNAIDVQGRCYDLYSAPFASNTAYVTCVVTDGAADFEPSNTATITSGGVGTMVAGSGTATGVFKTDASGYFKIRVTETAAANRFIWVRGGGHQQVYIKARDGILQLTFA
jgi:hypothetical protein